MKNSPMTIEWIPNCDIRHVCIDLCWLGWQKCADPWRPNLKVGGGQACGHSDQGPILWLDLGQILNPDSNFVGTAPCSHMGLLGHYLALYSLSSKLCRQQFQLCTECGAGQLAFLFLVVN